MNRLTPLRRPADLAIKRIEGLRVALDEARTFVEVDQIARDAKSIQVRYQPVREVADAAGDVWVEAESRLGEELAKIPKAKGTRGQSLGAGPGRGKKGKTGVVISDAPVFKPKTGVSERRETRAKKLASIPKIKRDALKKILKATGKEVTPDGVLKALRAENKEAKHKAALTAGFSADGPFGTAVIDPPWKTLKIDRDVRPNQDVFDYPTMSADEITALLKSEIVPKLEPDCHLFLWTTQRWLPAALAITEQLGFKYVLTMVWHKAGGFQPVDLPQYNCEFAIYARRGSPVFIDTTDFPCCFEGARREHSRKPDRFYEIVRRVTGGSRIDVFSREAREGFAQYGNESAKFDEAAE